MASLEESVLDDRSEKQSCRLKNQFDLTQWYFWSVWWQQCLFYQHHQTTTASNPAAVNSNTSPPSPPLFQPTMSNVIQTPFVIGGIREIPRVRTITGYESYIASTWRRLLAEFIDILLVSVILKWYFPDLDYRIPESIFLGADAVLKMEDDELEEMGWTLMVFVSSILLERLVHLILETCCVYFYGCTPGKHLLGLRIYRCTKVQLTRTDPGYTIKIQPGTRMGFWQSGLRALFKFIVNMFCPLIIFFIVVDRGRTQYDRAFKCVIVNTRELHRPVYVQQQ